MENKLFLGVPKFGQNYGLNIGTPKTIDFPFGTNGKSMILSVPILKHFRVICYALLCIKAPNWPYHTKAPGPCCSKLMLSLVNFSLKFQTLISEIRHNFLLKKCEKLQKLLSLLQQKLSVDLVIKW